MSTTAGTSIFTFCTPCICWQTWNQKASLPVFLEVLKKARFFQEYWFGDNIYEEVPELLAR